MSGKQLTSLRALYMLAFPNRVIVTEIFLFRLHFDGAHKRSERWTRSLSGRNGREIPHVIRQEAIHKFAQAFPLEDIPPEDPETGTCRVIRFPHVG